MSEHVNEYFTDLKIYIGNLYYDILTKLHNCNSNIDLVFAEKDLFVC